MTRKQKLFRIHEELALRFEDWCEANGGLKQERLAEVALLLVMKTTPDERHALFRELTAWKANPPDDEDAASRKAAADAAEAALRAAQRAASARRRKREA